VECPDPVTGNPVGALVVAGGIIGRAVVVTKARVIGGALSGGIETSNYWASIQTCDLASSAQIQGAVKNASDTNTLFKLTNGDRQRLQQ
jgi:hypothetical protein